MGEDKMKLKDFFDVTGNIINDGSKYEWNCFGEHVHVLAYWDNDYDGVSAECVYDTRTANIYKISVEDYSKSIAYRWIHPDYLDAYKDEVKSRKVNDVAWDDVPYIDLEVESDILEKASAILRYEDYDSRIQVTLDLPDDLMFELMVKAHEHDMTLNRYIEMILQEVIDNGGENW